MSHGSSKFPSSSKNGHHEHFHMISQRTLRVLYPHWSQGDVHILFYEERTAFQSVLPRTHKDSIRSLLLGWGFGKKQNYYSININIFPYSWLWLKPWWMITKAYLKCQPNVKNSYKSSLSGARYASGTTRGERPAKGNRLLSLLTFSSTSQPSKFFIQVPQAFLSFIF